MMAGHLVTEEDELELARDIQPLELYRDPLAEKLDSLYPDDMKTRKVSGAIMYGLLCVLGLLSGMAIGKLLW